MSNDYFSTQSTAYKQYRPTYPTELFDFLRGHLGPDAVVWDCATGNGQAAMAFSGAVGAVVATDQSYAQLARTMPAKAVHYVQALAEAAPLPSASVDLVTVAQALHWFDFDGFYREAKRVLKPSGLNRRVDLQLLVGITPARRRYRCRGPLVLLRRDRPVLAGGAPLGGRPISVDSISVHRGYKPRLCD